ncbi:hypothetical protein AB6735_11485 [Mucilaginibacter sp. RCC_168]|uniref:hypothetical protein n=1 Tax=Mucilaginibacter sp. RCC_168 TaxID=3239221 RepID=UPI003523B0C8
MKFDLNLSDKLYVRNLSSYLTLAKDNLKSFEKQNEDFAAKLVDETGNSDWLEEGSRLNNISWLFLNALYITMYSSFEHYLLKAAKKIEQLPNNKISLEHSGRGVLNQYINYLHLTGNLSSADRSKSPWDKISQYQDVRNLLVHNGGIMQKDLNKPLEQHKNFKFLQTQDVIMAGSLGLIRIRNIFILESFAKVSSKITKDIMDEFNKLYG